MTFQDYEYLSARVQKAKAYLDKLEVIEREINNIEIANVAINKIKLADYSGNHLSLIDAQFTSKELVDDIRERILEALQKEKARITGRFEAT